ncbi:hypothetical protein SARC_05801 [Sphaeroforma arctica JP610]|uniref:Pentacotripeptide-repeat region of PRORP domain-containing protein n=1 Tax=Sphaeroforma arctica JP610 TaxID=667725 RepID=A0A0L0G111_9EUKA|nr:hypothetical protein SARC_05801 [Sphaeroforma arctica JP610]KNC81888.1 hypothetical protein SARC_05801 [Sphaeroforma arctica JP610]|eukprot:XP_014155790.1 hypothetical protein SARC_05801 [Sphaeroforma arctica JP610]
MQQSGTPLGTCTIRTYKNLHGNPSHTERFRKARLERAYNGSDQAIPINPTLSSFTRLTQANVQKAQALGYDTMIKGGVLRIGKAPTIPMPVKQAKRKPRLKGGYGLGGISKDSLGSDASMAADMNTQPARDGTLVSFYEAEKHINTLSNMNKHAQVINIFEQVEALASQPGSTLRPTLDTINYVLHAYSARWLGPRAVSLMNAMESVYGVTPDVTSYRHVIAACSAEGGSAFQAMYFYKAMLKAGYSASELDLDSGLAVLGVCSEAGFSTLAVDILEVVKTKTSDTFKLGEAFGNTVSACAVHGDRPRDVIYLYEEMLERGYSVQDANLIDAMIAYADLGFADKTLQLYGLVSDKGKNTTDAVWCAAIKACHDLNWYEKALGFQVKMFRKSVTPSALTLKYTISVLHKAHRWENMLYVAELGGVCWNSINRGMLLLGFDRIDPETANHLVSAFMHTGHLDAGENAVSHMKSLKIPLLDDTKTHILTALTTLKAYKRVLRLHGEWDSTRMTYTPGMMGAVVQSAVRLNEYEQSKLFVQRADEYGIALPDDVLAEYIETTTFRKDPLETFRIFDKLYRRDLPFLNLGTVMHALRAAIKQVQAAQEKGGKFRDDLKFKGSRPSLARSARKSKSVDDRSAVEGDLVAEFVMAAEKAIAAEKLAKKGYVSNIPPKITLPAPQVSTEPLPLVQRSSKASSTHTEALCGETDGDVANHVDNTSTEPKLDIDLYVDKLNKIAERALGVYSEFVRADVWDAKNNVLDARKLTKHETKAAVLVIVNTAAKSVNGSNNGDEHGLCLADSTKDLRVQVGYPYKYLGADQTLLVNTSVGGFRYATRDLRLESENEQSALVIKADRLSKWCRQNPWPTFSRQWSSSFDSEGKGININLKEYAGKGLAVNLDGPGEVGWGERKVRVGSRDVLVPSYGKYGV